MKLDNQQLLLNKELLKQLGYSEELIKSPVMNLEKNNQGYDNLRYETEQGKKVYIHSQYNIQREFMILERELELGSRDELYIVYGLGLGYHIKELKKKMSSRSYIIVIEKNLDIVSTYMQTQNFSEIVGGNIFFFFGNEKEIITGFRKTIFSFNVMPLLGNIRNVILPSYRQIYGNWINVIHKKFLDIIRHAYFMLGNDMEDTIIGIKNNLENIDVLIESPSIELIKNAYHNKPAIIVSAGPSLDKNIHELKNAQGKALIIATDATLSILKKNGIVPDGVVTIERIQMTYEKFYKDKKIDPKIVFIGPPVVTPEIFDTLKNNKKLICLKRGEQINEWINNDIIGENRLLSMGTSCAHIAFSFAKYVGANPIIFVGQDLAYSKEGVTHADGVEVKNKIDINNNNVILVEGINGEMLPTSRVFKQFLTWFELEISNDKSEREYIDATEGGAYIQGTKVMKLENVIEKYCREPVIPLYEKVPNTEIMQDKYDKVIIEVKKLIEYFKQIKEESELQISRIDKLRTKVIRNKKKFSTKDREKIYKVLNQARTVENLVLKDGVARTLFQPPFMMAATKVRMLGNEINDEKLKNNVIIQRNMVASFIIGCYNVIDVLTSIVEKMERKQGIE